MIDLSQNKIPRDVYGKPLKFCQHVEILNGVGPPRHVFIGKVVHVGSKESVVEYGKEGRIRSIENKKLRIRF